MNNLLLYLGIGVCLTALAGCSTPPPPAKEPVAPVLGEPIVLAQRESAYLAFTPLGQFPTSVRSTYLNDLPTTIHYERGRDYTFDELTAAFKRTSQSRIPDFSTNVLHGRENFDHSQFPGYGNTPFTVFVDYVPKEKPAWPVQSSQTNLLPHTLLKLREGKHLTFVAFGDSITAGGEATQTNLIFWQRWMDELRREHPTAQITAINGATGGDTTGNGLARLNDKVIKQHPDLVLVAFGMNDHNIPGFGVPLEQFAANLGAIVDRIRNETQAEIVLVSAFPPNPKWRFGSHNMEAYALATEQLAREKRCAYADVYHNWVAISEKKKPEDLLGNNINHPNDFGHWIYFQVLNQLGL
jgi:acyl-CoA thioesterase-1